VPHHSRRGRGVRRRSGPFEERRGLKVAIVRQRYSPYGGAERFIERALPALERAGAQITLIARSSEGWGARQHIAVNPFYVGSAWRDASFARAARAAWEAGGFDLVQSHERIPGCAIYRAGDGVHAEWLDIRRADAGPGERLGLALNPYHRYVCTAERRMFQHAALRAVICNSEMVRGEIERRFGVAREKLHVIYNGVDLEHFHPRERERRRAQSRAELGLAESETLFLFVGSGFWRKGLDAAIGALAASGDASLRLAVVGEDRERASFAAKTDAAGLGGRVYLVGGRDEVRPLYAAADCFLLPTRYDPFPNTALEALAMGLPVIVGSRSGAAEIVREGESGWTCDPADVAGLGRLLREAAQRSRDNRMQAAARAVAEGYGLEQMATRLIQLYAAMMV
jgi:UDP-glucose:(heptosyl)LPS alpha-1,3-glucosyltransferase